MTYAELKAAGLNNHPFLYRRYCHNQHWHKELRPKPERRLIYQFARSIGCSRPFAQKIRDNSDYHARLYLMSQLRDIEASSTLYDELEKILPNKRINNDIRRNGEAPIKDSGLSGNVSGA
jgi:hypothetical protein